MKRDFHERAEALDRQQAGLAAQREELRQEIRAVVAAAAAEVAKANCRSVSPDSEATL